MRRSALRRGRRPRASFAWEERNVAVRGWNRANWAGLAGLLTIAAPGTAWGEGAAATEGKGAEGEAEGEHTVVVGVGGALDADLSDGSTHGGVNAFVEWNAVPGWLELELGASIIPADKGVEVPIGLLFKKPFKLAPWSELLIGIGPEMDVVSTPDTKTTYFGGAGTLDFMFWPLGDRVGFWIAPEYSVLFHDGSAESGLGATGGVMLGW
jgi:hypothetical protein